MKLGIYERKLRYKSKQSANTRIAEEISAAVLATMWDPKVLKEQDTNLSPQSETGEGRGSRARDPLYYNGLGAQ